MFAIQEEKKVAHPMKIMLLTWVCVRSRGIPLRSTRVIPSGVTLARVPTVSLKTGEMKQTEPFFINLHDIEDQCYEEVESLLHEGRLVANILLFICGFLLFPKNGRKVEIVV